MASFVTVATLKTNRVPSSSSVIYIFDQAVMHRYQRRSKKAFIIPLRQEETLLSIPLKKLHLAASADLRATRAVFPKNCCIKFFKNLRYEC